MIDVVNHPPHYKQGNIEVIEITRELGFDLGNTVKYLLRHAHKGNPKQDLEKAAWYLNDYISNQQSDYVSDLVADKIMSYNNPSDPLPDMIVEVLGHIANNTPQVALVRLNQYISTL